MNKIDTDSAIDNARQDINDILTDLRETLVTAQSTNVSKNRAVNRDSALKRKAINMLKNGKTTQFVVNKLPSLSRGQVAAFKAHVTMGTYA